jgi:hypothetical protein
MASMHPRHIVRGRPATIFLVLLAGAALGPEIACRNPLAPAAPPEFTVQLTHSQQATQALAGNTVIVEANVFGYPKPGTPAQYIPADGTLALFVQFEQVQPGNNAVFPHFDLEPTGLTNVDSRGPQLQIIVYTAFNSAPTHLLNCATFQQPLSAAQGHTLSIACKGVGE